MQSCSSRAGSALVGGCQLQPWPAFPACIPFNYPAASHLLLRLLLLGTLLGGGFPFVFLTALLSFCPSAPPLLVRFHRSSLSVLLSNLTIKPAPFPSPLTAPVCQSLTQPNASSCKPTNIRLFPAGIWDWTPQKGTPALPLPSAHQVDSFFHLHSQNVEPFSLLIATNSQSPFASNTS